jgi:hypothetical protein
MHDELEPYESAIAKIENNYVRRIFLYLKGEAKQVSTPKEFTTIYSIVQLQCGDDDSRAAKMHEYYKHQLNQFC